MPKTGPRADPLLAAEIGRKVALRRDIMGLTQRQLADTVGLCRNMITCIEGGGAMPSATRIPKLCRALEVSPNWLFGWNED